VIVQLQPADKLEFQRNVATGRPEMAFLATPDVNAAVEGQFVR
jgi:hypothetical protein